MVTKPLPSWNAYPAGKIYILDKYGNTYVKLFIVRAINLSKSE